MPCCAMMDFSVSVRIHIHVRENVDSFALTIVMQTGQAIISGLPTWLCSNVPWSLCFLNLLIVFPKSEDESAGYTQISSLSGEEK